MTSPLHRHPTRKAALLRLRGLVRKLGTTVSHLESRPPEVRPPALWGAHRESVWASLLGWLRNEPQPLPERVRTIDATRSDFLQAMADLDSAPANGLRHRVNEARSLRELWHLRTELYGLVARHISQAQAEQRLARINRHFPAGTRGH